MDFTPTKKRYYIGPMEFDANRNFVAANFPDGRFYLAGEGEKKELVAEYQHKDHLGNVRVAFSDRNGDKRVQLLDGAAGPSEVTQINDYFPFGLQFPKACGAVVVPENRYQFNGIEHIAELELDMAAFRSYDAAIGRWMQVDPLAEKYYAMSPYNGMGNNPILYSDPMGDSINIRALLLYDQVNKTNISGQLIMELSDITGLNISTDKNGNLTYKIDENGKAVVTDLLGKAVGSSSARKYLSNLMDHKDVISVNARDKRGSATNSGGLNIGLDPSQIASFVTGTPREINRRTLGLGMVFLHELHHTGPGGSLADVPKGDLTSKGPTVSSVNVFRSELDQNYTTIRPQYGQRDHYTGIANASGQATIRFTYSVFKNGSVQKATTHVRY